MSMSRRHYQDLAVRIAGVNKTLVPREMVGALHIVCATASVLKQDNPRFDVERFMEAAGIDSSDYYYSMLSGDVTPR